MMTTKHLKNPVTLTIELDDLIWLRAFLKGESLAADIDHEEVERLHTDAAIRAAKAALRQERDRMAKVVDAMDATISTDDLREAAARKIAAMTPPVA